MRAAVPRAALALALGVAIAAVPAPARAGVERYAVIAGHNSGAPDEQRLRFAEADAARVAELLGDLGGVPDENQIVLRGKTADQLRRALIATNERIRMEPRGGPAVLIVYYSGHGDADALHLGDTRLALRELEALVRGSPAQVRILVIDSCRSGSLTRVKGGRPGPPLALSSVAEVAGEGLIVLASSAAGEDAQESDALGGSFFTHYLLSGLRGAADADGDQLVTVAESFRYARDQTILASSRTTGGTQHPTFYYDLRGRAELVLADLGSDRTRGRLTVPPGATWLIARAGGDGGVVGEIVAGAAQRTLSLRPGRYAVRGRTRDALLEGAVAVAAGAHTVLDADTLERTTYARLVRKGHGAILDRVLGVFAGPAIQTPVIAGAGACTGGVLGGQWVRADVTLSPRLAACRGGFRNETLTATTGAVALELRVAKVWDVGRIALDLGVTAGAELLLERFETRGVAPDRTSAAGVVGASAGIAAALLGRLYAYGEGTAQTHVFRVEDQAGERRTATRFALRAALGVGAWF